MLMEVVKPAGAMGIIGVYTHLDPGAPNELAKQGKLAWSFPKAWVKSPSLAAGQCPVMRYNRDLMMAILWDRMPYLTGLLNTEIIPLERRPRPTRCSTTDRLRNSFQRRLVVHLPCR